MDFGLSRICRLVRGYHKVLPWKAVHIAGTNGKGTTSRYLEALLERSNIVVGLFNSPHLVHRRDCIRICGRSIHQRTFDQCEELVKQRNADAKLEATAFELLTATAFECFIRAKVEVAIIECGLGGRLDATNILLAEEVLCSVITRIGLDHQDVLGDTVEEIAAEKAGIIKSNVPVVVDRSNLLSVKRVIKQRAEELGSPFALSVSPQTDDYLINNGLVAETAYKTVVKRIGETMSRSRKLRLLPKARIQEEMAEARKGFGGRFQSVWARAITRRYKPIILDGAHNEQAATALRYKVDALSETPQPVTWVMAMSSTKSSDAFLNALVRPDDTVIFCEFGPVDGMPWVRPQAKEVLASLAHDIARSVQVADSPGKALKLAAKVAGQDGEIIVAGSLYLVGDILRLLQKANQTPEVKRVRLERGLKQEEEEVPRCAERSDQDINTGLSR
ncbi:hypothetical protein DV737_g5489, partial [Chaetothyriales sp. CBS 132003]